MNSNKGIGYIAAGLLHVALFFIFLYFFGNALLVTFRSDEVPTFATDYVTVCNLLLGGVVAALASAKLIVQPSTLQRGNPGPISDFVAGLTLPKVTLSPQSLRDFFTLLFFIVYLILGIAALVALATKSEVLPDLIRNFALVFAGSVIPMLLNFPNDQ